jgi:hypothetical protein
MIPFHFFYGFNLILPKYLLHKGTVKILRVQIIDQPMQINIHTLIIHTLVRTFITLLEKKFVDAVASVVFN